MLHDVCGTHARYASWVTNAPRGRLGLRQSNAGKRRPRWEAAVRDSAQGHIPARQFSTAHPFVP